MAADHVIFGHTLQKKGPVYLPGSAVAGEETSGKTVCERFKLHKTLQFANLVVWIVMVRLCWQVFMPSGCSPALLRTLIGLKPSVPQRVFRQICSNSFPPLCFHVLDPTGFNKSHRMSWLCFSASSNPKVALFPIKAEVLCPWLPTQRCAPLCGKGSHWWRPCNWCRWGEWTWNEEMRWSVGDSWSLGIRLGGLGFGVGTISHWEI